MKRGLADMPHLLERLRAPLLVGGKGGGLVGARGKLDVILTGLSDRLGVVAPLAEIEVDADERGEAETTSDGIAVIPIVGSLVHRKGAMEALSGMTSYAEVAQDIDAALADKNVKGILLEIDSPGGEVSGCFELADKIAAAKAVKPIHAIANSMACSAAYAIACATDSITLTHTGDVGSVGVVAMHVDQSGADKAEGLKVTYVYAGDRKVDGNPHEALSPRAHAAIQEDIDKIHGIFVKHVASNLGLSQAKVRETQAGTFMGEAAVAAGFADQVGTLDDALAAVRADVSRRKSKMSLSKVATKLSMKEDASEEQVLAKLDESAKAHAEALARADAAEKKAEASAALAHGFEEKLVAEQRKAITERVDAARSTGAEAGVLMNDEDRTEIIEALASADASKRKLGGILLDRYREQAEKGKASRTPAAGVKPNPANAPKVDLEHEARSEESLRSHGFDVIVKDEHGRIVLEKCSTPEGRKARGESA